MSSKHYYTDEKNTQIVIALLKAHGIRDVVISPGATNDRFVLSVQGDPDFNLYSAVDERHAGYLACGMAQETGRPVVINCTGATASRNYMPALTEAYYRKLPVLALTCSQHYSHIGNMYPQMTDRIHLPADVVNLSVQCPIPHTKQEEDDCVLKVNRALLELHHRGGGPVHVNLETEFSNNYTTERLPVVRKIDRVMAADREGWTPIHPGAKVIVWIGSHRKFSQSEQSALERFVDSLDAVVLGDVTSNCSLALRAALLCSQVGISANPAYASLKPDLIIHIGEISGDYPVFQWLRGKAPVWRVSEDGELRDFLGKLEKVYEMPEETFFKYYGNDAPSGDDYRALWRRAISSVISNKPNCEFSEQWIVNEFSAVIPSGAYVHLGILNPLRCWNAAGEDTTNGYSTVGGFGIDGGTSSMLGTALASPDKLNFGVFGDLAFFYDLNSIGSRHLGKNVRILVINNGEGGEFSVPGNISDNPYCGERVHEFIAAEGHYGNKSNVVLKHLSEDLGFIYLSATDKTSFAESLKKFVDTNVPGPVLFECFTNVADDRSALEGYRHINACEVNSCGSSLKSFAKNVLPTRVQKVIKVAMGRSV